MEELIQLLEKQIRKLIDQHNVLKQSNQQLRENKTVLSREKELLLAKQQKAVLQIEALVSRLKAIEKIT